MNRIATIKVLENGEIKIPKDIREDLQLKAGTKLLVIEEENSLLLKRFETLSWEERFERLAKATRREFKRKGITKREVVRAIQKVRSQSKV